MAKSRSRRVVNSRVSKSLVHLLAVDVAAHQVVRPQRRLQVAQQVVEPPVADHLVEVVAQALPGLAADLVGVPDDAVEPVELQDPLRGGLRADPGHAGQVVAGLPTRAARSG